jgi:restriction system protein
LKFMPVPDFQTLMLPVLKQFADGTDKTPADVRGPIGAEFGLTTDDLATMLPSGRQTTFANRVAWALGYLKQSNLLESPRHAHYRITERGREVLRSPPERIDISFLERYPDFQAFRNRTGVALDAVAAKAAPGSSSLTSDAALLTPDEQVRAGAERIRENLATLLLYQVKRGSPAAFERLVVDLLVAMGYGGSHKDAAQVVGKSGDGGIDGIIKEDRLGLENIYVQAKRWDTTVGRPAIQQFAGALHGHRARKGVVITTSNFSREAIEYAKASQIAIVLIDGTQLTDFMIEFGIGVTDVETIKIKRLDMDYFGEE